MNDKKYIAFLDILGFKDLVLNNKHERLIEVYHELFVPAIDTGLAFGKINIFSKGKKMVWEPDFSAVKTNSLIVSDSILLWTNDTTTESFLNLTIAVQTILNHSFRIGFPLRGAIVYGDLNVSGSITKKTSTDNSTNVIVGEGLVRAYSLEEMQKWSGCIIDETAIEEYQNQKKSEDSNEDFNVLEELITEKLLSNYSVPMKQGKVEDYYVIDWVSKKSHGLTDEFIRFQFSSYEKTINGEAVESIIRNTLNYIENQTKESV